MKKSKVLLLGLGLVAATVGLSSCTASFCSVEDKSAIMFAYDIYHVTDTNGVQIEDQYSFGVSSYYDAADANKPSDAVQLEGYQNIYVSTKIEYNLALVQINTNAKNAGIPVNDFLSFWADIDLQVLNHVVEIVNADAYNTDKNTMTAKDVQLLLMGDAEGELRGYGYTKYCGVDSDNNSAYWVNWDNYYNNARLTLGVDSCPDSDYVKYYKNQTTSFAQVANSCIATTDGFYGYYGFNNANKVEVFVTAKDYSYAWSKGFLEGLIIYPISWLIDSTTNAFMAIGAGLAQVLAIFVVTFLIRAIMMILTIKQTTSNARMNEVQPELAKIQAKYPNSNTNRSEQQAMAAEMQALYKKHNIHPFLSILTMIVQFPVFICVWGAMNGSAVLSSDAFLGLRLSESVSSVFFDFANWPNNPGWWTAVVVFLIMAVLQILAMILPQIISKRKQKQVAKLGKNPAAKKQGNKMKWFTIIMCGMIIFMGFSLASGMVIYWIAGSIWSIAQTLIIEWISYIKKNNKNKPKKPAKKQFATQEGLVVDAEVTPTHMQAPTGKKKYKDKE